jgi:hypothetical protein
LNGSPLILTPQVGEIFTRPFTSAQDSPASTRLFIAGRKASWKKSPSDRDLEIEALGRRDGLLLRGFLLLTSRG